MHVGQCRQGWRRPGGWLSRGFNRINRAMGLSDLYPFTITAPVQRKLAFVHDIVTRAPLTTEEQRALALATPEERA
ncbi:putative zinc-binding metallopeptidase [Microbacterium memoriense]|uniref:Zinc-binding metallopeptidase n=1 Tax=Microbacterium memoriense TaxID=2978350 RepID=A0ABT2PC19_9MICO|nr:putative zinc-binding metallopeptidase [Microbacterium memoriense]MCT9002136.1 putative zinc-binding metallopeptidase [Microbacterium memoriense]